MIPVDEALARVLSLAPAPQPEDVDLADALGRVLLEPAVSRMTQPPFDAAASPTTGRGPGRSAERTA